MSSSNARPPARRGPSGAWGRLRQPQIDPLEVYGLPSKGETRLADLKTQETYFERIPRYLDPHPIASGSKSAYGEGSTSYNHNTPAAASAGNVYYFDGDAETSRSPGGIA
ncbi:hypothetical protein D6D15_05737 [Aureobasidium pullulans]|uniref:Uncharacterized protein n=1 Tax=Aureobasidium pullulans TaxID=5580 RepID=A0A4S9B7B4_AURPU|nr:hypothetical protein D6D15_05737 [Aureobasidium pullulans]